MPAGIVVGRARVAVQRLPLASRRMLRWAAHTLCPVPCRFEDVWKLVQFLKDTYTDKVRCAGCASCRCRAALGMLIGTPVPLPPPPFDSRPLLCDLPANARLSMSPPRTMWLFKSVRRPTTPSRMPCLALAACWRAAAEVQAGLDMDASG